MRPRVAGRFGSVSYPRMGAQVVYQLESRIFHLYVKRVHFGEKVFVGQHWGYGDTKA